MTASHFFPHLTYLQIFHPTHEIYEMITGKRSVLFMDGNKHTQKKNVAYFENSIEKLISFCQPHRLQKKKSNTTY